MAEVTAAESVALVTLSYLPASNSIGFTTHIGIALAAIAIAIPFIVLKIAPSITLAKTMELDSAEIGLGSGKLKLRPNIVDRQVAYAIWVELSTRKIGLPINLDDDVISEIYDSWYQFFAVTRDLIKTVPVARVSDPTTKKIIQLSIDVLNEGLRPHLTKWQARFRRWNDRALTDSGAADVDAQSVQAKFPKFVELRDDMLIVNERLIAYRAAMFRLVHQAR